MIRLIGLGEAWGWESGDRGSPPSQFLFGMICYCISIPQADAATLVARRSSPHSDATHFYVYIFISKLVFLTAWGMERYHVSFVLSRRSPQPRSESGDARLTPTAGRSPRSLVVLPRVGFPQRHLPLFRGVFPRPSCNGFVRDSFVFRSLIDESEPR